MTREKLYELVRRMHKTADAGQWDDPGPEDWFTVMRAGATALADLLVASEPDEAAAVVVAAVEAVAVGPEDPIFDARPDPSAVNVPDVRDPSPPEAVEAERPAEADFLAMGFPEEMAKELAAIDVAYLDELRALLERTWDDRSETVLGAKLYAATIGYNLGTSDGYARGRREDSGRVREVVDNARRIERDAGNEDAADALDGLASALEELPPVERAASGRAIDPHEEEWADVENACREAGFSDEECMCIGPAECIRELARRASGRAPCDHDGVPAESCARCSGRATAPAATARQTIEACVRHLRSVGLNGSADSLERLAVDTTAPAAPSAAEGRIRAMAAAFATRAETDPDRHVHGVATGLRYAVEALDSPAPASSPAAWDIVTLDEVYRRAGRIVPDACCDRGGQHYGIASVREIVTNMMRDVLPPAPADGEEREP